MVAADLSLSNKVLFRGVPEACGPEEVSALLQKFGWASQTVRRSAHYIRLYMVPSSGRLPPPHGMVQVGV